MDPALAAFLDAIMLVAIARATGRVSREATAKAVAGAVLGLGLTVDEVLAQIVPLAQEQTANTIKRLTGGRAAKESAS